MSFWSGVVQGVKDIDVLKEKEALADERQGVRDEENAYRDRMAGIQQAQWAAADARAEEEWAYKKAAMGQTVLDSANGLGIGGPPATGGGGGSVPTPDAIMDSNLQFGGWSDTQLSDESLSQEDVDYVTNLNKSFVDPKDAHEYWSVITGIRETTGSLPTVAQLRASVVVTQIPGYADNKAKAVETLASINSMDVSTPEGLAQATTLYNQLKKINLNSATIDADLSGFLNVEDLGKLHKQQVEILDTELATNWLSVDDKSKLDIAEGVSKEILMGDFRRKYGPQALEALTGSYPQQFSRYADNPAFRSFMGSPDGGAADAAADAAAEAPAGGVESPPAQAAEEERRRKAFLADPEDPVALGQALEAFGKDGVDRLLGIFKEPYKEYGESRQSGVGSELQAKYGEEFGQAGAQKVAETAWTVLQKTGEYMLKGADRAGGVALGSVNEVGSWLGVGLGFMNEAMGLDGTPMFQAAGELDDVAGQLFNGGISSADASQKLADMWRESLTREGSDVSSQMSESFGDYNGTIPTREEISTGSTPEGAAIKEAINALVNEVQQTTPTGRDLDADNLVGFDPGQTPNDDRFKSDEVIKGFMERNPRESVEAELGSTRSEGYRPTQMGATELNLPKFLEGLSEGTRKAVEAELGSTRSEGYRPTQMGATELNLPKFLEGLSEGTRKAVEAELAVMPKQEAPTVSLEDLSPDDLAELEAGVEEVISAIVGNADQGDIEVLVRGLNDKFTTDIVGVAMRMAMGS